MRRQLYVLFSFFLLLIVVSPAKGQGNPFSEAEFQKTWMLALKASSKLTRRIRATEETKSSRNITGTNYYFEEFIPPDRERFVDTISSAGKSFTSEIIKIGKNGFSRDENGIWIEWTGTPHRPRSPKLLPLESEWNKIREFSIARKELDGQQVKLITREETGDRDGIEIKGRYRIWISFDGLIRKTEYMYFEKFTDKWVNRTVTVWEYEAKDIVIESPIK